MNPHWILQAQGAISVQGGVSAGEPRIQKAILQNYSYGYIFFNGFSAIAFKQLFYLEDFVFPRGPVNNIFAIRHFKVCLSVYLLEP